MDDADNVSTNGAQSSTDLSDHSSQTSFHELLKSHVAILESHASIVGNLTRHVDQQPNHHAEAVAMQQRADEALADARRCALLSSLSSEPSKKTEAAERASPPLGIRKPRPSAAPQNSSTSVPLRTKRPSPNHSDIEPTFHKRRRAESSEEPLHVPVVEYQDLTAEVDARLARREQRRRGEDGGASKRKRESDGSAASARVEGTASPATGALVVSKRLRTTRRLEVDRDGGNATRPAPERERAEEGSEWQEGSTKRHASANDQPEKELKRQRRGS